MAVVQWVEETWYADVGGLAADETDPAEALMAIARGHAVYCRRDVARVMMTLKVEFAGQDHSVGRVLAQVRERLLTDIAGRVEAGRGDGTIPPGPPAMETATAYLGALEGLVIALTCGTPFDVELADRAARGVLGLPPAPLTPGPQADSS
ncbi:hypothetical protein ACH4UT_12715 [Streptomyces sp. NPDC020799]|uniref:hypothetical protein n=1 Tax=Streptomyces sp. NPDC020799 TaxID=3365091 RepID=UPI00379836A0